MASTITIFNDFRKFIADGTIDLDTDTIKAMMLSNGYTVNAAHSVLADIGSNEVAAGNGYVAGGQALANKSLTVVGAESKFTADPLTWASLTKTYRFLLLYAAKTANGKVNPLIAVILVDNTPADVIISAADYSVQWNANGILVFS